MASVIVSAMNQMVSSVSKSTLNPAAKDIKAADVPVPTATSAKENAKIAGDTVALSTESQKTDAVVKSTEFNHEVEDKKKMEAGLQSILVEKTEKFDKSIAKVQFSYNLKGEISLRYLDTSNNLIYQVPSELMMQLKDSASKSETSVNTKV